MVDISIIPKDTFLVFRNIKPPDDISKKYEDMFVKYDCFSNSTNYIVTTKVFPSKQNNYSKAKSHSVHSQYDNKKKFTSITRVTRRTIGVSDTPDRHYLKRVKAILNVINDSNFDKQLNKLKFIIQEDNIDNIMEILINSAVLQVFYIHIFVKLFKELLDGSFKAHVLRALDNFVSEFISQNAIKYPIFDQSEYSEYDCFCLQQKHKTMVTSKACFIINIIKHGMTAQPLDSLTDYLSMSLSELVPSALNVDLELDIILNIMLDVKKNFQWEYTGDQEILSKWISNKKIAFLVERLREGLREGLRETP